MTEVVDIVLYKTPEKLYKSCLRILCRSPQDQNPISHAYGVSSETISTLNKATVIIC